MNIYNLRLNYILDTYAQLFLNNPNIIGVGIGNKRIRGIETGKPSLLIFVKKKVSSDSLSTSQIIPKSFYGINTDVVEFGDIRLLSGEERPAYGGLSIGIKYGAKYKSGTIGYAVTDKVTQKNVYFITCNHCVTPFGIGGNGGIDVYQPSIEFGGKERVSEIGKLAKAIEMKIGQPKDARGFNEVDAAMVLVGPGNEKTLKDILYPKLKDGTSLVGIDVAKLDSIINIQGAASGKTSGKILSERATFKDTMPYGPAPVDICFQNQIVCEMKINSGDSGALGYLEKEKKAVGMLWGGSSKKDKTGKDRNLGIFSPINRVLDLLNVELVTSYNTPFFPK